MKKNLLALTVVLIMVMVSLAGCGGSQPSGAEQGELSQSYDDLLNTYYNVVLSPEEYDSTDESKAGVIENAMYLEDAASDTIGYLIEDINGDDIPELIIGTTNTEEWAYTANDIYALYTLKDGAPQFILGGRSRNTYSLMNKGQIFNCGSNGAAHRVFGVYEIDKNAELSCKEFYFSYERSDDLEDVGFYYNTTGIYDKAEAKELKMDYEEFSAKEESFAKKTIELKFIPFSQYEPTDDGGIPDEPDEPEITNKVPAFCGVWRCNYQGTDGNRWLLHVELLEDGSALYKCGPPESEFMVNCVGTWKLNEEGHILLDLVDTYEGFPFNGEYNWAVSEDGALSISRIIGDTFIYDTESVTFVFGAY